MRTRFLRLLLPLALSACQPHGAQHRSSAAATAPNLAALPSGDVAGSGRSELGELIHNPDESSPAAVADGKRLFVQMNCAGCHGYDLGGSMGPNLKDGYWRYGGSPAAIYRSISKGHPQGMPAWSQALPPDQIWKLVAYIQSFGAATAPGDEEGAQQGDYRARRTSPPGGTGAQAGAKGASAPAAQPANP
jgi:cytochrome c oxidase cbb3-type subunit 3